MDKRIFIFTALFAFVSIVIWLIHGSKNPIAKRTSQFLQNNFFEFILVVLFTFGVYRIVPHFFFDDSGFILRHLDHFTQGYLFKYNIDDPSVYGVSGFIHGIFTGLLCRIHLTTPEQALTVSNLMGFGLTAWFVLLICKKLIKEYWLALLVWLIAISASNMYWTVAFCGLETSLHFSIITAAIYFFFVEKNRLFFFFTALMIVSKLDAVPVAGTLMLFYLIRNKSQLKQKEFVKRSFIDGFIFFVLPLSLSFYIIYLIFGSVLPQSAYAKIYYHSHPSNHWFPFLEYFIPKSPRIGIMISFIILGIFHLIDIIRKRTLRPIIHFMFGSIFIGLLTLYYFYNPGEKMSWYYALPEFLLLFQIVYSIYYFSKEYLKPARQSWILLFIYCGFSSFVWLDVYGGVIWSKNTAGVLEDERKKLGEMIGEMSNQNETLLSSHGFLSRPFKGKVLDLSGLNSKEMTNYKRDAEKIIHDFAPDYIVDHAHPAYVDIYNRSNYFLLGIYRDVTISGSLPWLLLKRAYPSKSHFVLRTGDVTKTSGTKTIVNNIPYIQSNNYILILSNDEPAIKKNIHFGVARNNADMLIKCWGYKNAEQIEMKEIIVPSLKTAINSPSSFIYDVDIDITGLDSIELSSKYDGWGISYPIYQMVK